MVFEYFTGGSSDGLKSVPTTVDEEKAFNVALDEAAETAAPSLSTNSSLSAGEAQVLARPGRAQRQLTECSMKYDRDGKGYLDPTEQALRDMDTTNSGFLGVDKLYEIMGTLQREQKNSANLIQMIRKEQNKTMNLKKGVIALCIFTVLLALANIGTSFAAAVLAKDTRVNGVNGDLEATLSSHARVGTTNKLVEISMQPVTEENRQRHGRHLRLACEGASDDRECHLTGQLTRNDAHNLYKEFCPLYSTQTPYCIGGGVPDLIINCQGQRTTILGGMRIPASGPANGLVGTSYYLYYPSVDKGYSAIGHYPGTTCTDEYPLTVMCPNDGSDICYAFAFVTPTCGQTVGMCPNGL